MMKNPGKKIKDKARSGAEAPANASQNAHAAFGRVLQALLLNALSLDNLEPFLGKTLGILAGPGGVGAKTGLAIIFKCEKGAAPKGFFLNLKAADKAALLTGCAHPGTRNRCFSADIRLWNAKAGRVTALFARSPASPPAVRTLLEMAAKSVSARLQNERRDAELNFEKDLAEAVKHVEELYLSFPAISIEEISRAVLDEARRMTGSTFGFAGFIDQASGQLRVSTLTGDIWRGYDLKAKPLVFARFKGLWGWVLKNRKPLLTNAAPKDKRSCGLPAGHLKIDKFLGAPALSGRKLLGMLALANPRGKYSAADLETASKLARVYAMILQRKMTEDARRAEDERFRAIISASQDIIYTVGLDGRLTYISPKAADYGYAPEEMIGRQVTEFAHPDDSDFLKKAFAQAAATGRTLPVLPYRIKKKDGSFFYAEQKSGVVSHNGRPEYIAGVIRDVTEQKKTELLLKENEAVLRMIFDTATDAIFIKDMNGVYIKANRACAALMGVTQEKLEGMSDWDFFPKEIAENIYRTDSEAVRTGKTISQSNEHPFPTGKRHVHIIKTPLKNIRGEVIALLGIARDITDIKKMEKELALAQASEAISKVARPIAHDFNNALAAINGYATLIDDDLADSSPIKTEITQIIKAVKRAAELTSQFQDFARIPNIEGGNAGQGNK